MTRCRFLIAMVFAAVACTDNPDAIITGPIDPVPPLVPAPLTSIVGRVRLTGPLAEDRIVELEEASGVVHQLVGTETGALTNVDGAGVIVRGTFAARPVFVVQEFLVISMHGLPALDGVLEASEDGIVLRLESGVLRDLPELTAECTQFLGVRVWVTGWDVDSGLLCGIIAAL